MGIARLRLLPWMFIAAGAFYCLWLLSFLPGDVYYSGDGGIKSILVRQAAAGYFGAELQLPADDWLRRLWEQGLYPFAEPFVYRIDNRYVPCFPVFLPGLQHRFTGCLDTTVFMFCRWRPALSPGSNSIQEKKFLRVGLKGKEIFALASRLHHGEEYFIYAGTILENKGAAQ